MKSPLKSRTIIGFILIALGKLFIPGAKELLAEYPEVFIIADAISGIILRLITKDPIRIKKLDPSPILLLFLLLSLLVSSCSSIPQKLDPKLRYRNDLPFCVDGYGCFEGVTVLPRLPSYKFEISPKGDANIDLLVVTTCNRNKTFEKGDPGVGWGPLNIFGKIFGKKKEGFTYLFIPLAGKEDDGDCHLMLQTYEKDKGRHAWALIKFEHPKYKLPATLFCDGETISSNGSSICQGKTGLIQWIRFPERVMIEPGRTENGQTCSMPKKDSTGDYAWKITNEECGYTIVGESGRLHDMTATGYVGEVIREVK